MKKFNRLDLFDQHTKVYVKLVNGKKGWERHISIDKKNWRKTHTNLTLEEALTIKKEIIDNNFKNLFKIITRE